MNKQLQVMKEIAKIMNERNLTANRNEDTGVVRTEIPTKRAIDIEEIIIDVSEKGNIDLKLVKNLEEIASKFNISLDEVKNIIDFRVAENTTSL